MGAAVAVILVAGGYIASTNGISISDLAANIGAVLGFSDKNEGELVAVIPLNKFDKKDEVAPAKQDKKLSQIEPKQRAIVSNRSEERV